MSCYIPYDARENGPKRETYCGRYILPAEHAKSPTCATCVVRLAADRRDAQTGEDRFGAAPMSAAVARVSLDVGERPIQMVPLPAAARRESELVLMFERLAMHKDVDVEKLGQLIHLQERILDRNAKTAFDAAFATMQSDIPEMPERGERRIDNVVQSTYAREEDIQRVLKPILKRHGFSLSFRTEWPTEKTIKLVGILTHVEGHARESEFVTAADSGGSKNAIQALGSAISYGHRYTTKDLLNITSRRQDDDGQGTTARKPEMARATIPPREPDPAAPAGYAAWWTEMQRLATQGFDALQWAWADTKTTSGACKAYATRHQRAAWEALKASALKVRAS